MSAKEDFLFPRANYRGNVRPENLVFNANMQEFAQRVSFIVNLETNGKITPEESYHQIKALWKQVKQSKKALKVGQGPFTNEGDGNS
jgi:glutathione peroxidase-family protein